VKIDFVNHASLVLSHGDVRLLCDPWLHGRAFNEGWALLAPTVFRNEEFETISHIWYSHEHPDHFSPRCLAGVRESLRPGITVLFHESDDRKIIRHCAGLGFATRELARGERVTLGPDFHVRCSRWDHTDDSWLLVEAGGARVLNLNDCMVNRSDEIARLKSQVGPIDVLATQFSIAAWDGNAEDVDRRRRGARTMLERTVAQCRTLEPRWLIPFASFVWFCHEENHSMNSAVVRVDEVAAAVAHDTRTTPVVLYPGDSWQVGGRASNAEALERYAADYRSIPLRERVAVRPVPMAELQTSCEAFLARVNGAVSPIRLRIRMARMNASYQRRAGPAGPAGGARPWRCWGCEPGRHGSGSTTWDARRASTFAGVSPRWTGNAIGATSRWRPTRWPMPSAFSGVARRSGSTDVSKSSVPKAAFPCSMPCGWPTV